MAAFKSFDTLSNENVMYWLKKAEEWALIKKLPNMQNHVRSSLTLAREISQSTDQLGFFLSSVHSRLDADGISQVLKNHPKLGHLLGRLFSCHHLIAENCEVYSKLLTCVQALRAQHPQDGMEKKAKDWAESQIRHSASYYHQKNPASDTAESLGYSAVEYNIMSSNKLIESIQRDLDHLIAEQHHYIHSIQDDNISLEELTDMCLPLLGNASSMGLVDRVLLLHPESADDQVSDLFLERVTQTQDCAYDAGQENEFCLTREALTSLWLQYLPALEQEILLLLQAFSQHASDLATADALKIIHSRDLPRACAEHKIIYEAVDSCVQQVLWQTNGSLHVIQFVHLFQVAVNEAIQELKSPQYSVHRLFPQRLCPLVNLLTVDTRDLPQEAHGIHLTSIQATLKTTIDDPVVSNNPHEMYAVWMTVVKFLQWYHAAVYTLIRGYSGGERCGTADACLGFVIWFHHPLSFGNCASDVKDSLYRLIRDLHSCIMGKGFQRRDLERLFLSLGIPGSVTEIDLPVKLILNLVMSAILQATSLSTDNVLDIMDMMCSHGMCTSSSKSKLALLHSHLDIHQNFMVSGVGFEEACPVHVTEAIRILQENG